MKLDFDALLNELADRVADRVIERMKGRSPVAAPGKAYLDSNQAADLLAMTPEALGAMRRRGKGPPFLRIGRLIRYNVAAIEEWLEARRRQ